MKKTGGIFEWMLRIMLVFVILKLCGIIRWSWLWVLAPLWLTAWIIAVIILILWWINRKE